MPNLKRLTPRCCVIQDLFENYPPFCLRFVFGCGGGAHIHSWVSFFYSFLFSLFLSLQTAGDECCEDVERYIMTHVTL